MYEVKQGHRSVLAKNSSGQNGKYSKRQNIMFIVKLRSHSVHEILVTIQSRICYHVVYNT